MICYYSVIYAKSYTVLRSMDNADLAIERQILTYLIV